MEIGLLLCDEVSSEYKDLHGTYTEMFQNLFPDAKLIPYKLFQNQFPKSSELHAVWMTTGSRFSAYDSIDWIVEARSFIRSIATGTSKFIGNCFGHQLLAEALDGKVEKVRSGWEIGVKEFTIDKQKKWMIRRAESINILMMCQDQVTQLPSGSERLASSPTCPNGMYIVDDRLLGIQGHPEFSKAYDQALMESRIERIGRKTVNDGIESLDKKVDRSLIADWLMQFCAH